jgi:hypothetical protein
MMAFALYCKKKCSGLLSVRFHIGPLSSCEKTNHQQKSFMIQLTFLVIHESAASHLKVVKIFRQKDEESKTMSRKIFKITFLTELKQTSIPASSGGLRLVTESPVQQ